MMAGAFITNRRRKMKMNALPARLLLLLLLTASMIGCPLLRPPKDILYTSADMFNANRSPGVPALFTDAEADGESGDATRAVEEPDIYRRDGSILYVLNQYRGLTLIDLDTREVLSRVPTQGYPRDLYLRAGRAYVLTANAADYDIDGNSVSFDIASRLYVVDVSTPESPTIQSQEPIPGDIVDSRLVGGILYAVSAAYSWSWYDHTLVKQQSGTSWVTSVDIGDAENVFTADQLEFTGASTILHATADAIFAAAPNWSDNTTSIQYIDISDVNGALLQRGAINIAGEVADRFKLDVYEGVLRVVSQTWTPEGRRVLVTTVDLTDPGALTELAQLELEDAADETLFATRFDGPRAYIVTYFIVDPLFVVDLSDPADPALLGELTVPGWSTHIEPYGDRLLAMGVDDTDGRRISVSLFDVAGAPQRLDIVTFGENWAWSSAYNDVKAFAVLDDLIVVPFSGWNNGFGGYDRLQLISWNNAGLQLEGTVDLAGQGIRTTSYNGLYYGLSQEEVAIIDAADRSAPEVVDRIGLADDVADLVPLAGGRLAEIIRQHSTGETAVRVVTPQGTILGETAVSIGDLREAHSYGDGVVLVGMEGYGYGYGPVEPLLKQTPGYQVAYVRCLAGQAPEVVFETTVDVTPYYGFYWWPLPYYRDGIPDSVSGSKQFAADIFWMPFTNTQIAFAAGDILALRCQSGPYDRVFGNESPEEGLALVDLETGDHTATLGLGVGFVVSVGQSGDRLYVGTREEVGGSLDPRPLCAYYLAELNVTTRSLGPLTNVPGTFVQFDRGNEVLVLRDQQWNGIADISNALRTVQWDGVNPVTTLDDLAVPSTAYRFTGEGATLFGEAYDNGYGIFAVIVGGDGALERSQTTVVTRQWASLQAAHGAEAYVSVGSNAIARYRYENGAVVLEDLTEVMAYPTRIRFDDGGNAYAVLGYTGWAAL
jgi:uncharacterized secreted protein with C-terminal beta-propeller domain